MNEQRNTPPILKMSWLSDLNDTEGNRLVWSIKGRYPRLTLFYNEDKAKAGGYDRFTSAPMDFKMGFCILEYIRTAARAKEKTQFKIIHYNAKYEDGVKTNEKAVQATTYIGKDENGYVYISIVSPKDTNPKPKFVFNMGEWYNTYKDEKQTDNTPTGSVFSALSYVKIVELELKRLYVKAMHGKIPIQNTSNTQQYNRPSQPVTTTPVSTVNTLSENEILF